MKRFLSIAILAPLLALLLALLAPASAHAASPTLITATITITNTPTTNGMTLTVNSNTRTWTNSVVVPASQILTNLTIGGSATNLFLAVSDAPFTGLALGQLTNGITLQTVSPNGALVASSSAGWCTIVLTTNTLTSAIAVRVPLTVESPGVQTNVASLLVSGLESSTNSLSATAPALANYDSLSQAQTITGQKTIISPIETNDTHINSFLGSPNFTNAINRGNALSSPSTGNSGSEQFGQGATALSAGAQVFGAGSSATGSGSLAVGGSVLASGANSSTVGSGSTANGPNTTGVGAFASTAGQNASAFGEGAIAGVDFSTALGTQSHAGGTNSTAIGQGAVALFNNSTALGQGVTTTTANQVMVGTSSQTVAVPGNLQIGGVAQSITHGGTNLFPAGSDISFGRYTLSTLANGNNAGVVVGTNVFVEVSGPSGAFTINGIAGGRDGKFLIILNHTTQAMTIANDSGVDPTAANRIYCLGGGDQTVSGNSSAVLIYNAAYTRWIVITFSSGATPGSYTAGYAMSLVGSQFNWNAGAFLTNGVFGTNVNGIVNQATFASVLTVGATGAGGLSLSGALSCNGASSLGSASSSERFGNGASATGTSSTAVGASAAATALQTTSLGQGSLASASQSTALGSASSASHASSTAVGYFAADTEAHQVILGTSSEHVGIPGYIEIGSALTTLITTGAGSPNTVVTAPAGSLYLNTSGGSGTTLYVKESGSGNTGWVGK